MPFTSFSDLIDQITPDMHTGLQRAVQLGKFPDGRALSAAQKEDLLRTLIAWEHKNNVPEAQRTGSLPIKNCSEGKQQTNSNGLGQYDPSAG